MSFEAFVALLKQHEIAAIADVRSTPHSGRFPWFSHEELKPALLGIGIQYVFLGRELGGRPRNHALLRDGVADYRGMAQTPEFAAGIDRLRAGARKYRVAMLCSEADPLDCHRTLLVGRHLASLGMQVIHIRHGGGQEDQAQVESRLLKEEHLDWSDLLWTPDRQLDEAYLKRSLKVAYAPGRATQGKQHGTSRNDWVYANDGRKVL